MNRKQTNGKSLSPLSKAYSEQCRSEADSCDSPKLRILKFGGTSVGDEFCISKVLSIIRSASQESSVVVVVSAMGGVTNRLIEAGLQSEAGRLEAARVILQELRKQHDRAVQALIHSETDRNRISLRMDALFEEADQLCHGTALLRQLTARTRDAISGLGERLVTPILASALMQSGIPSKSIESSDLLMTDSCHGSAEPQMERTRELCNLQLRPLLQQGIVPVVTGFIGATVDGVPTTLGRGGSDYSATILGAALDANEIVIWTDVDGLMTADPRLIPDATPVYEISYREASELAYFGAKVLHPKTLRAIARCGVPVWIRNTFATDRPGTRITPSGMGAGVKALAAVGDASLIRIGGPGLVGVTDALGRTFATIAAIRADALLISQSSSQNDICLVVGSSVAKHAVEALRREFAHDLAHETLEHITVEASVAIVAVVGHNVCAMSGSIGRTMSALAEKNVDILAMTQGSSQCVLSFVVRQGDMKTALSVAHLQFELASPHSRSLRKTDTSTRPVAWFYDGEGQSANAD